MSQYDCWGTRELIERIHELEHEHTHILAWIICEAWTLLEPRNDKHARNWRGYAERHAGEVLKMWSK